MEKKIMYTENVPDKKFLWLHTKNGNLILEVFGNHGWESIGDDTNNSKLLNIIRELSEYNMFVQFVGIGDERFSYLE